MNIVVGIFIFSLFFAISTVIGLLWLFDMNCSVPSFVGISSLFIAGITLLLTISLVVTLSDLDTTPLEEKDIVSIENNIENFKISNAVLNYNNDSETKVDIVSIEALEDYEYVLIKYRLKSGKFYLDKSKLELRKKEK